MGLWPTHGNGNPRCCHPRVSGGPGQSRRDWIPAFAGMTATGDFRQSVTWPSAHQWGRKTGREGSLILNGLQMSFARAESTSRQRRSGDVPRRRSCRSRQRLRPNLKSVAFCHTFPQFDPEKGLATPPNPRKRRHLKNIVSLVSSVSTVSFSWVILVKEWLSGRDMAHRTLISKHRKASPKPSPDDSWKGSCFYVAPKTTEIHTPRQRREPGERQGIPL